MTRGVIANIVNSEELANILNQNKGKGATYRAARMLGMLTKGNQYQPMENIPNTDRSLFSMKRYEFLLAQDAPKISNLCCDVMKKEPTHKYGKQTGRKPITAEMAVESKLRTQKWMQNGCNGFQMKSPKSTPMAFWTEQDVLLFIKSNNIKIPSVYGNIVKDKEFDGQMDFDDFGIDLGFPKLKTTGCKRTGCMFCGFGCHLEKPGEGRFEMLKHTHPKQYEWIMKPWEEGGLGYKDVIDWINENNGKGVIIRY